MIEEHVKETDSAIGREILENFDEYLPKFKKVIPFDYEKMQTFVLQMEEKGLSSEQAKIEAFYAIKSGK
jgi:glutamate synthase (ferredoxin)